MVLLVVLVMILSPTYVELKLFTQSNTIEKSHFPVKMQDLLLLQVTPKAKVIGMLLRREV